MKTIETTSITPYHDVVDYNKYNQLVASMEANGWLGRPIAAIGDAGAPMALTGSHRIAAARELSIAVPVLLLTDEDLDEDGRENMADFWQTFDGSDPAFVFDLLMVEIPDEYRNLLDDEVV